MVIFCFGRLDGGLFAVDEESSFVGYRSVRLLFWWVHFCWSEHPYSFHLFEKTAGAPWFCRLQRFLGEFECGG